MRALGRLRQVRGGGGPLAHTPAPAHSLLAWQKARRTVSCDPCLRNTSSDCKALATPRRIRPAVAGSLRTSSSLIAGLEHVPVLALGIHSPKACAALCTIRPPCVQALTSRPVKGMLTGPVTILNW
jgi:hypothetical protein